MLADNGLMVVGGAESVSTALWAATRLQPLAALVDVGLPDGDGFTLARQLTALPWHPYVVLTSVDADAGTAKNPAFWGAASLITRASRS